MFARVTTCSLTLVAVLTFASAAVGAENVAAYRGFRLGMTVSEVAAAARVAPATVKTVYERPLLIQELEWDPPAVEGAPGAPSARDSVARVMFGFCTGELYRIVVTYDGDKTEGMTEQDMIEALSAVYGPATRPATKIITSPAAEAYTETEDVRARWEDGTASVNLFVRPYRSAFGLVIFSKRLAALARTAIDEGARAKELDEPRRELARQKARDDSDRAAHAVARVANKANFRY